MAGRGGRKLENKYAASRVTFVAQETSVAGDDEEVVFGGGSGGGSRLPAKVMELYNTLEAAAELHQAPPELTFVRIQVNVENSRLLKRHDGGALR